MRTKHIATEAAGFLMQGEKKLVQYAVTYTFHDLKSGQYTAVVTFQNPANSARPYQVIKSFTYPVERLLLDSPGLSRIESGRNYDVLLVLHKGDADGPVVDTHAQKVNFNVPPEIARAIGIETMID